MQWPEHESTDLLLNMQPHIKITPWLIITIQTHIYKRAWKSYTGLSAA